MKTDGEYIYIIARAEEKDRQSVHEMTVAEQWNVPYEDVREKGMISQVAEFDQQYFGADRTNVLTKPYERCPKMCLILLVDSKPSGYVMCRKLEKSFKLGLWICDPEHPPIANDLFIASLQRVKEGTEAHIGVPSWNKAAISIPDEFQFETYPRSVRMRYGKQALDCVNGVFAFGNPMKR